MRTLQDVLRRSPAPTETGLSAEAAARSAAELRRQPAHAAAARAAVEEVPRKVRRADHQDPAGGRPAVDVRRSVPGATSRAGRRRARRRRRRPWSAPSSLRQGHWLPTLLFVSAVVLFFVGLVRDRPHRPARRGAGRHGRRHPGDRRGLPQRVQERPRIRGAQRPQGGAARQGAARRRLPHGRPGRGRGRRSWWSWKPATRSPPTAGWSRRRNCTWTSR